MAHFALWLTLLFSDNKNILRYLDTPVLCIYLLKQNTVIVPDEIYVHQSYPGKNI